jgi:hypothetical protein
MAQRVRRLLIVLETVFLTLLLLSSSAAMADRPAQPASNECPLLEVEPLSLCSDLLRVSVPIPTVSSEGQKSKIFRDTPRSLCRRFLLFTQVRGIGILGSSDSGSCIDRPRDARHCPTRPATRPGGAMHLATAMYGYALG